METKPKTKTDSLELCVNRFLLRMYVYGCI